MMKAGVLFARIVGSSFLFFFFLLPAERELQLAAEYPGALKAAAERDDLTKGVRRD